MTAHRTAIEAFRASDAAGGFLFPSVGETAFARDLDGAYLAQWLRAQGYEVTRHWDTGANGRAETACGLWASTNGWFGKIGRRIEAASDLYSKSL
jgi:hypothetical protein